MMKTASQSSPYFFEVKGLCAPLPVVIKKRRGSRNMVLKYQPVAQSIALTLPWHVSVKHGLRFIEEKRGWVLKQLEKQPQKIPFEHGQIIPILGENYTLTHVGGRGVVRVISFPLKGEGGRRPDGGDRRDLTMDAPLLTSPLEGGGIIEVPGDGAFLKRRVLEWIKKRALEEITLRAQEKATSIGARIKKISVRDTHSRWGSCTRGGNLSFSWRLLFAPPHILDYVVAHEVAHLREFNHGPKFWKWVADLCPHWQESRRWIKKNGSGLYRYG